MKTFFVRFVFLSRRTGVAFLTSSRTIAYEWRGFSRYFLRRPLIPVLLFYCLVIIGLKKTGSLDKIPPLDPAQWAGRAGAFTGVVARHPDPRTTGCVYTIKTETAEFFDEPKTRVSLHGLLLLHVIRSTAAVAQPGDRVRCVGRIQTPSNARLPGAFDYESYLENQGIRSVLYTSSNSLHVLGPTYSYCLMNLGWRVKQKMLRIFSRHMPSENASVLAGLALGVRPRFHPDIKRVFTESGTMHILVASGSNVAFVVGLCFLFFHLVFRIPKNTSLIATMPVIGFYVAVVGWDAPIMRAGVMATVAITSFIFMREDKPFHALAVAALILLLNSPRSLFDVGFQMSFVTVFGLIQLLPFSSEKTTQPAWRTWLFRLIFSTLAAQMWLLPITTNVFRRFFISGFLANIVMLPGAALGISAALVLVLADNVNDHVVSLGQGMVFTSKFISLYLSGLIRAARFFSDGIGKSVWLPPMNTSMIAGYYISCVGFMGVRKWWTSRLLSVLGIMIFMTGYFLREKQWNKLEEFSIDWLDTGRTTSCLLKTRAGENILINPGPITPTDTAERLLIPFLMTQGVRSLRAVVATQEKPDQSAGLLTLAKSIPVERILLCIGKGNHLWTDWFIKNKDFLPASLCFMPKQAYQLHSGYLLMVPAGKKFNDAPAIVACFKNRSAILAKGLSLEAQDFLLTLPGLHLSLLQARFSPRILWRPDFVQRFKPSALVDIGTGTKNQPAASPWRDIPLTVPQQLGWWRWNSTSAAENKNTKEAGSEASGVRPPGHAPHFTANRLRRERTDSVKGLNDKP